ncbi:MAG: ornithine cyclodeaminase family protein [Ilumatobacteraceae bacterium]
MQHFDDAAVTALIDHAELVDATAAAFADLGTGRAATTVRVRASAMGSMASAMAAAVPSLGVTGGKLYSTVDGRFTFHVVLFDLDGRLLCTMDGAALTEARTPALCAVAIRRWVGGNADVAAVLGTGREALPHLRMLARELPGAEFRLWGRRSSAAESVVRVAASEGIAVVAVDDADDAVTGADVVVTVTSADDPIVSAGAISDRALVCAVGATKPQRCELDPELFGRARAVVTDSLEGAPGECGDLIRAVALGRTRWEDVVDLSDVLAGTVAVSGPDERPGPLVFETQGVAIQDVVAAALVWRRAEHHSPEPVTDRSAIDRSATDQEASR